MWVGLLMIGFIFHSFSSRCMRLCKWVSRRLILVQVHAVMGKNGSGRSTFAKVLVGHPDYEITGGSVTFKGKTC